MSFHHDSLFQACFGQVEGARSWLRHLLPVPVSALVVWDELQPWPNSGTTPNLRRSIKDLLFQAPLRGLPMPAFFAPEHKSSPAPELLDQLLYYYVHTRTAWRQSHRDHPLVFLVVLHHGRRRFRAASTLRLPRAFDPDTAVALQRLQPHVPFVLDDLTLCREQDILARPLPPLLRLAMLSLQFLPGCTDQAALAAIERWGALLHSVSIGVEGDPVPGQLAIETIASSFLRVTDLPPERVAAAIAAVTQPRDWSVIMSTYDRAVAEGRVLGKLEGKAQGQAELCLRLLTARFGSLPESIQARVRSGSDVDFERWALRLLDAASLAEVFAHE